MPVSAENRNLYPSTWAEISRARKDAAGWCCEGISMHPRCAAVHGELHPDTGSMVFLTTAHINHDPRDNRPENLAALCQRCHLRDQHLENAAETRRRKRDERDKDQLRLFEI